MEALPEQSKVWYDNVVCIITLVWNHGWGIYYDLEEEKEVVVGYKRRHLSIPSGEIIPVI
jgi:hypothetical protein